MTVRRLQAAAPAALVIALLAGCDGWGGGTTGGLVGGGGGDGVRPPDPDITLGLPGLPPGTSTAFADRFAAFASTLNDPRIVGDDTVILTPTGTAVFTGTGTILESGIPATADTLAELRPFLVVMTDATAAVDFGSATISASQAGFVDLDGNPVAGSVVMSATPINPVTSRFSGPVSGSVAGTGFAAVQAGRVVGTPADGVAVGAFAGAVGAGGLHDGRTIEGGFAVED